MNTNEGETQLSCKDSCSMRWLTFGYGSYSQRNSYFEVVNGSSQPATSVDWVIKVAHIDSPHCHTDHTDDLEDSTQVLGNSEYTTKG